MSPKNYFCTSNNDCNEGNGLCISAKCECKSGYVGGKCQFPDPCSTSPCKNDGKCVAVLEDGSFYCDCKPGFIDPTCTNQDPCLVKGNNKCLNGSTCRRKNDFEFVCECQYPYTGTYCETYDLCLVDEDECIDDLNVGHPDDPRCAPCVAEAQCYQLSVRHYACTCSAGVDDPSCHSSRLQERSGVVGPTEPNPPAESYWNPIIPSIALSTCVLYIIFVIIVAIFLRKQKKRRPRLIVCCDVDLFEQDTYYLISVQTGKQFKAGAKSNIYCFLRGVDGQAGPFPLNDANLREVHVLEKYQEDNYLVSCPSDLGRINEVVIFYDDRFKSSDSWFCRRITIRNIKTDENWFFFVSGWIDKKIFRKKAATPENVQKHEMGQISIKHFFHRLTRSHIFIAPFRHPTAVRVTLTFAEIMAYMFFLIVFLGFIPVPDPDMKYSTMDALVTLRMLKLGTLTAVIGVLLGCIYAIFFIIYRSDRIPTLVISRKEKEDSVPASAPPPPAIQQKEFVDASTQTDPEPAPIIKPPVPTPRKRRNVPQKKESIVTKDHVFRIPSTDIAQTEGWVSNTDEEKQDNLVHDYISQAKLDDQSHPLTDKIVEYGFIGSLRDNRQQNRDSFVYKTDSVTRVESALIKDIAAAYENLPWGTGEQSTTSSVANLSRVQSHDDELDIINEEYVPGPDDDEPEVRNFWDETPRTSFNPDEYNDIPDNLLHPRIAKSVSDSPSRAGGDFNRKKLEDKETSTRVKSPDFEYELCEMGDYKFGKFVTHFFIYMGWFLCVGMIITSTVICCIYGGRYGYERTYTWGVSLGVCLFENLLVLQLLKVLVLVAIMSLLVAEQKIPTYEARRIHDRFQVYYKKEDGPEPETFPLQYVRYLPEFWQPIAASVNLRELEEKRSKKESTVSYLDSVSSYTHASMLVVK